MRFIHHFAQRYVCEVDVDDQPPGDLQRYLNFYWSPKLPKLTPQLTKEYTTWICEINRLLADKWDMKLMHCIEVSLDVWELWAFAPGEAPRLLETLHHTGAAS